MTRATGFLPLVGAEDWEERGLLLCKGMCFGMNLKPFEAEILAPGEISWGSLSCRVIHTPGHSEGSLCYYFADLGLVITGDLLFFRSVGRTDLPGGDGGKLVTSLRESIYTLPDNVVVYPGHGPETSIGYEKAHNCCCRG